MNPNNRDLAPLEIPYFQQTRTATCGPACLMMVMKYWDPSFEFSRRMEFYLWKKSFSFFLFGGTYQFGLAVAAKKQGFQPMIYQKGRFSDGYPNHPSLVNLVESIVSRKVRRLQVPIVYGSENNQIINDALRKSIPPIVFINLLPLLGENVFHWVVVTGVDEQNVFVNDPYVPKGSVVKEKKNSQIPLDRFSLAMATQTGKMLRLPPCVLLIKP